MTEASAAPAPSTSGAPAYYRWIVLLSCALAMFGCYYVFYALAPVAPLLQQEFGFSDANIGQLDTAYNIAALLTLIAGGVLIDRLGTRRSALLFGAIGAAGGLMIAVLPDVFSSSPVYAMLAGRFVLGIGSELFIVAATTVVGRWFKGKEISFALALQLLVARAGSWAADKSPQFAESLFHSWQAPLLLAAGAGGLWLLFSLLYEELERAAEKRYAVKSAAATDKLVWKDLVRFPLKYWWIVGLCVAFYATIFPFRSFLNLYLVQTHDVTAAQAGALKSHMSLIALIFMPIFGLLADKVGRRGLLMTVGSAFLVPPFLLLSYTQLPPTVSMVMLGIAFALVPAVLWPAVTYVVPEARLGSAYALMTFCQQAGWGVMSPGVGWVNDAMKAGEANPAGWLPSMWIFAGLASVGFVFAFLLWRSERGEARSLESAKPSGAV